MLPFGNFKVRIVLSGGFFDGFKLGKRGAQRGSRREDDGSFDEILKLAYVTGPMPFDKRLHGLGGNDFDASAHALGMNSEEVPDQNGNIVEALAQGWNREGEHAQAIIEVTAELSRVNHFGEVAIRRCQESHIYGNRTRSADTFELLLLQRPQNFRLEFQREIAYLIQKKSTLMS